MAVFSNVQIRKAIKDGHIVCTPFDDKHVSQASLDVTLGNWYYSLEKLNDRVVYNPFDREDVERYFDGPYKALTHKQWADLNGYKLLKNIPPEHPIIVLKPGERILAHTHEFVGINPPGACEVKSRSSMGRNGVAVCFDAGWVDPGYINRITLEIYNLNKQESVVLPVGERIGQIIFHETGEVDGNYGAGRDGGFSGKYQQGTDIEELIQVWTPDQMVPKSHLDKRVIPEPIEGLDE
jgi:deoxycytidine triphosphate deaminase